MFSSCIDNIVLCLKNSIPISHIRRCYASKKIVTAHKHDAKMRHMIQLREGYYASNDSSGCGAAKSPAALARGIH
jgi:hypothetical protein